jgi:RHS repeat-associated protein
LVLRDRDADGNGTLEERLYVQQDANFNVTAIISATGAVQERYACDPYRQPMVLAPDWSSRVSSLFAWNYLHQGGRYDGGTGLYYFRHRDYSPALGRWVETDPLGLAAGEPNLYRSLANNPPNALDPSGLQNWVDFRNLPGWRGPTPNWSDTLKQEVTSAKASVNAGATTLRSTATLGIWDEPWEIWGVSPDERTGQYRILFSTNRVVMEGTSGFGIARAA